MNEPPSYGWMRYQESNLALWGDVAPASPAPIAMPLHGTVRGAVRFIFRFCNDRFRSHHVSEKVNLARIESEGLAIGFDALRISGIYSHGRTAQLLQDHYALVW